MTRKIILTINGEEMKVSEVARLYGLSYDMLYKRLILLNWDLATAIATPRRTPRALYPQKKTPERTIERFAAAAVPLSDLERAARKPKRAAQKPKNEQTEQEKTA